VFSDSLQETVVDDALPGIWIVSWDRGSKDWMKFDQRVNQSLRGDERWAEYSSRRYFRQWVLKIAGASI
jgi:hypothetical protein